MKKVLTTAAIISAISSASLAETKGNYMGVDLINTDLSFEKINDVNVNSFNVEDDSQISAGIYYRHAFNFDGFFVAPGVFFDYSNVELSDSDNDTWNLDYTYGVNTDLGYDFTGELSAGINLGIAINEYEVNWDSVNSSSSDRDAAFTYGLFASYSIIDNLRARIGYEYSEIEIEDPNQNISEFNKEVFRIGLAYKF